MKTAITALCILAMVFAEGAFAQPKGRTANFGASPEIKMKPGEERRVDEIQKADIAPENRDVVDIAILNGNVLAITAKTVGYADISVKTAGSRPKEMLYRIAVVPEFQMKPGEVRIFDFNMKIADIYSAAGQIIDVAVLSNSKMVVTAKQPGNAEILVTSTEPIAVEQRYSVVVLDLVDVKVHNGVVPVRTYICEKDKICRLREVMPDTDGKSSTVPTGAAK